MKDFCSPFEARKVMPLIQVPVGVRINIIFGSITRYVIGDFGGGDILRNLLHQTGDYGPLPRSSRYSSNLINSHPPYPSLTKIQQWQQASSSQALVNVPFVSWAALAHTVPPVHATQTHLTSTSTHVSKPCHSPGASTPLLSTQVKNMHLRWRCRQFDSGKDVRWKLAWMSRIWESKRCLFLLIKPWGNCFL
jgi:hypothetical protein